MEETGHSGAGPTIDGLILRLHTHGESVFQAMARAATVPGVDRLDPALLGAVPEGHVPLRDGRTAVLPRLDAAGVAAICTFELEQAGYEAERVLVTEPSPPRVPRIESRRLWPALRAGGYRVGPTLAPIGSGFKPRHVLAEHAGIHPRTIDRICSGSQKTVAITTAIAILGELPRDSLLGELEADQTCWETAMSFYYGDRLEYLEQLGAHAPSLLATPEGPLLSQIERAALEDLLLYLREAHREASTEDHVRTPEERLQAADRWFREALDREPTLLSSRLKRRAEHVFRAERQAARARQRALAQGLQQPVITPASVYARVHRLRRAGRLPAKTRPIAFRQPANFDDISD